MAYVPVPKDLSKVKTKVAFNLTKRQILCFSVALLMGLPLFFLFKDSAGTSLEICKELKAKQIGTVLVLTARDKLQDELHALDLGADDYLTKPCNMSRLLARIKNLLRRKEEQVQQGLLDGGGFLLDPNTFTIYVGNSSYLMPPNEGKILLALLKNSPKIVSKKELCIRLWGTEEFIDENALQVNFTRLRKTLREFGLI